MKAIKIPILVMYINNCRCEFIQGIFYDIVP